ncbi:alternate-type signal peptide domain-containing protein [Cryobacterium serini]|uniref:Alternate-type signal peptide domain-containing protein n=1 Tax=Cryobacterium serini TaxID=1259201 RepID=A0A4R9BJN8_9MICO|nr:alternate-type signal peptide domain-containing protein [Cryobacterium serini]TFD85985.1 alternate-type signal peptide domain-containing protein [Cryobacterium serini]
MNKLTKGAIAGAAGLTLLLGGGTTFALWNSSADVAGGAISAGTLTIASVKNGSWHVNGAAESIDLAQFRAVPSDVLVYTETMTIAAAGDNLTATLAMSAASITADVTGDAADEALARYLKATAVLTAVGTGISPGGAPYTITGAAGTQTVDVTVTISFPSFVPDSANRSSADEQASMGGAVDLAGLSITLDQKARPAS